MSSCISTHGEHSKHEPDERFTCKLCGFFDETEALDEIERLRSRDEPAWSELLERIADLEGESGRRHLAAMGASNERDRLAATVERVQSLLDGMHDEECADRSGTPCDCAVGDIRRALDGGRQT